MFWDMAWHSLPRNFLLPTSPLSCSITPLGAFPLTPGSSYDSPCNCPSCLPPSDYPSTPFQPVAFPTLPDLPANLRQRHCPTTTTTPSPFFLVPLAYSHGHLCTLIHHLYAFSHHTAACYYYAPVAFLSSDPALPTCPACGIFAWQSSCQRTCFLFTCLVCLALFLSRHAHFALYACRAHGEDRMVFGWLGRAGRPAHETGVRRCSSAPPSRCAARAVGRCRWRPVNIPTHY